MLTITEVKGNYYPCGVRHRCRMYSDRYLKFDWGTGYMIIQKTKWDKLPKKKKNLVLMKGLE